jgi:hypothetical protein
MDTGATPTPPAPVTQLRTLVGTLMGGLVLFGVVAFLAVGAEGYPPTWAAAVLGALAVVAHLTTEAVGYRTAAVAPGTSPQEAAAAGLAAYRTTLMLRFAICEAVAIVALAATFVLEPQTAMTYLVGGTLSLALLAWHCWPGGRVTRRLEQQLDRDGGRSGLGDALQGRRQGNALL